jgi:hypothetical protein
LPERPPLSPLELKAHFLQVFMIQKTMILSRNRQFKTMILLLLMLLIKLLLSPRRDALSLLREEPKRPE